MRWKYRKLLNNLGNAVQALCGRGLDADDAIAGARPADRRGRAAFAAAGIDPVTEEEDDARRGDHLQLAPVAGDDRAAAVRPGRAWPAVAGVETDFLNGEIALLGRLHGVPTPANARIQTLMAEAAAQGAGAGCDVGLLAGC